MADAGMGSDDRMNNDRLNVHVIMSPVVHDSRVIKEARALLDHDAVDRVVFAALGDEGLADYEEPEQDIRIERIQLRTRRLPRRLLPQVLKLLEWCTRVLYRYGRNNVTLIVAHDLEALPVAVLLKLLTGAPLHYDAHELETHRLSMYGFRRTLARLAERTLIRFADSQTTVSDSIAEWYATNYRVRPPVVVRNIPDDAEFPASGHTETSPLRTAANLTENDIAYLYVGVITPQRGIATLVDIFESLPASHPGRLVLLGPRDMEITPSGRVRVLEPVPHDEVPNWIVGADVGFSVLDASCLNHLYALPNKLFQYLLAGVPVIASPFPEMQNLLQPYGAGWFALEPDDIRTLVHRLDRQAIETAREGARRLAATLSWAEEARKFIGAIESGTSAVRSGRTRTDGGS